MKNIKTIFLQNKYTTWYYNIINNASNRVLSKNVYTEKHHIIPKCLGGSNKKDNLIVLTAKEHYVCHLLLVKMVSNSKDIKKMNYSLWMMSTGVSEYDRYKPSAFLYEIARKRFSNDRKGHKGHQVKHTVEEIEKMKLIQRTKFSKMSKEEKSNWVKNSCSAPHTYTEQRRLNNSKGNLGVKHAITEKTLASAKKRENLFWINDGIVETMAYNLVHGFNKGRLKRSKDIA